MDHTLPRLPQCYLVPRPSVFPVKPYSAKKKVQIAIAGLRGEDIIAGVGRKEALLPLLEGLAGRRLEVANRRYRTRSDQQRAESSQIEVVFYSLLTIRTSSFEGFQLGLYPKAVPSSGPAPYKRTP